MNHSSSLSYEARLVKLVDKVIVVLFAIPVTYLLVYKFFDPRGISIPLLTLFFTLPLLIFVFNRFGEFNISKILGLLGYNVLIFLVASSEDKSTGVHLHLISCCAVSVTLFRYTERWKSYLFIAFSVLLFMAINLFSINLLPFRQVSTSLAKVLFITHTAGTAVISSFCVFMVLGNNYDSRKRLLLNKEVIEQQYLELTRTNEELDRFVYSASHDLRAPLSSILGLVNLMEIDQKVPREEYFLKIRKQLTTMDSFLHDIVDYSRNSRLEVRIEPINIYVMINDVYQSLSYFEHSEKINFKNTIGINQLIRSDPHRLQVILNNIISNAVKYADLSKEHCFIKVSFVRQDGQDQIRIEDNGFGIKSEHLPRIFDMFYRASDVAKGSGLGLYIAMESARKMNWSLSVESEYGKVSVFRISFPTVIEETNVRERGLVEI